MNRTKLRVLIVDDDQHMLSAIVAAVEQLVGMETITADSAVDALSRLEEADVDCIVCDYGMPGMNGIDLLTAVRSRFGPIPFVLLTGQGSERVAAAAIRADVTDYVTKADGWPERLVDSLEDIRQFDARGDTTDRRFREAVRSQIAYGLYMLEVGGRILTWNDGAEAITGHSAGEIIGAEYATLFSEADVEAGVPEGLLDTAARAGTADFEGWRPVRGGQDIYVREHLVSVDGDDGGSMLVGAILQDHTDQHRYERQLARQNDRLREFTSIISHDLRNPLGVVSGRIDLARETGEEEHLEAAEEAIARMESYVDDLLVLAKQGQLVGRTEPVDLASVARDAWIVVGDRDPNAVLELPDATASVSADRARLRELFENLFLNSVEHGSTPPASGSLEDDTRTGGPGRPTVADGRGSDPEGPSVTVTVGPLEDGFYVADDGPGFDDDGREHAFEHGFTTTEDGTGFGLSIVETICRAHGWDIELADGPGARFEVTGVGPSNHSYPVTGELNPPRSDGRSD